MDTQNKITSLCAVDSADAAKVAAPRECEGTDKPIRSEIADNADKADKSDKSDKSAKSDKAVKAESKIDKKHKDDRAKAAKKPLNKGTIWTIKITVVTFVLSAFFSFISELTSSHAHISVMAILLVVLVALSIVTDAIGVAATSCDLAPLLAMASRKEPGSKKAIMLVKNAERVSNICCDVIGDICGIISGACTIAIVIKITVDNPTANYWVSILLSSIVAAVTVGGKSFFKTIAVNNSKELIMFVARILSVFSKDK